MLHLISIGAHSLAASLWLTSARETPPLITGGSTAALELALLPVGQCVPDSPLLPGETCSITCSDATSRVLAYAAAHHHSCCGLLLSGGDDELGSVTSLLEIEQDGERVQVKCVGRARLLSILHQPSDGSMALLRASAANVGGGVVVASVEPHVDEMDDASMMSFGEIVLAALTGDRDADCRTAEAATSDAREAHADRVASSLEAMGVETEAIASAARERLEGLESRVREAHARVITLRSQLYEYDELAASDSPSSAEDGVLSGAPATPLSDLRALGVQGSMSLDDLIEARISTLLPKLSGGGSSLLCDGGYRELWGVREEGGARLQLLSFTAVATLGESVRIEALFTRSTTERLLLSLSALSREEKRLSAVLALLGGV